MAAENPYIRKFGELVAQHQKRLDEQNEGNHTTQVNHTSLEDESIDVYDDQGVLRSKVGRQSDGRFAVTYGNGPAPETPTAPLVSARELGVAIGWDGSFTSGSVPSDFQRVDIHVSETSGFTPDGTTVVGSLMARGSVFAFMDAQVHYVRLVAVTTSQVPSSPTAEVSFTPLPATNLSVTNDILIQPGGRIIAGDPNAERIQMGENGIRQFDEEGDATVIIGDNPSAGNTITIRGTTTETRRNLSPNPKLQNNSNDWQGTGATLSRVDGTNVGTDWAFRAEGDGSDNPSIAMILDGLSGRTISFSFTVYSSVSQILRLRVSGEDPQGNTISATNLNTYAPSAGEMFVLSGVMNIPEDMTSTQVYVESDQTAFSSPDFFDVSLMLVEESPTPRQYFDGDSTIMWVQENAVPNPGFEEGVSGWTGTVIQSSDVANNGSFSGKIEPDGTTSGIGAATDHFPTHDSQSVEYEFSTFLDVAGIAANMQIRWYDADHALLTSIELADLSGDAATTWVTRSGATTAPAGARFADFLVAITGTPAVTDIVYVDDVSALSSALDQTTSGVWTSAVGNSHSTIESPPTRTRTNLSQNPKLDNNASHYGYIRMTNPARVDGSPLGTGWMWQAEFDGSQTNAGLWVEDIAAVALQPYVFKASVVTSYEGLNIRLYADWWSDGEPGSPSNFIGSTYGRFHTLSANTAYQLDTTLTAPASAMVGRFYVLNHEQTDPPAGNTLATSLVLVEDTDRFDGYFDGDDSNSSWKGVPGDSQSVLTDVSEFQNETRASLSDSGTLAVQSLSTTDLMVEGESFSDYLNPKPNGFVTSSGNIDGESSHTTGTIGWIEVGFIARPNRAYKVSISIQFMRSNGTASQFFGILYTTDGTVPTVNSPSLFFAETGVDNSQHFSRITEFPENSQVRMLLIIQSWNGDECWGEGPLSIDVEDVGTPKPTGFVTNDGGGNTAPEEPPPDPPQQYNTHWRAVAGQTWNQHGFRANGKAVQGFYPDGWNGDNKAMFFFDWANIQSVLAGSTIDYVDVYVYFYHWYYNSGGTAVFGVSNKPSGGGAYEIFDWGIAEYHVGKGAGRWCPLPLWVGHGFRDNWIKTINLDSAFKGHDLVYYGNANWDAVLSIGYTK